MAKDESTRSRRVRSRAGELQGPLVAAAELDWEHLIATRAAVLKRSEGLPEYLLLPEVHRLLQALEDSESRVLFGLMWYAGARVSEALAVQRKSFVLGELPSVSLTTLQRRTAPTKLRPKARRVPIGSGEYLQWIEAHFRTNDIPADARVFGLKSRQGADLRLKKVVASLPEKVRPPIEVSCKTLRASFAINCILQGTPLPAVQRWLGIRDIKSVVVYTQVLTGVEAHLMASLEQ